MRASQRLLTICDSIDICCCFKNGFLKMPLISKRNINPCAYNGYIKNKAFFVVYDNIILLKHECAQNN